MGNRGNYASRITEHPRASVLISLLDASLQKMESEIFKKYEKSFLVLLDKVWGGGGYNSFSFECPDCRTTKLMGTKIFRLMPLSTELKKE